jgi:hypothetical protein
VSRTLDILERAVHGTPAGFTGGCRSRGGCPHHRDRERLTCTQAYRAYVHYFLFRDHTPDQPITRTMLRHAKGLPT